MPNMENLCYAVMCRTGEKMTPSESNNYFYNNRYSKEKETFVGWCDVCNKDTKQTLIVGHTGLDGYSYCVCLECGNKY